MTTAFVPVGRARVFGDDIDTDVMMPGKALRAPVVEARQMLFDAIAPGFASTIEPGDVIIGGQRFGAGSARPVAMHLRALGVVAIFAETMSSMFQRGSINAGVLAIAVPGVRILFAEGDPLAIDDDGGVLTNMATGAEIRFAPLPELARRIVRAGGVIEQLVADGYLPADEPIEG